MEKLRILNLYAGIGGNRKLWPNGHDITAIEYNKNIANIYKDFFPNDNVIVADAHAYLLDHYKEYDFIWSSPPCPTHSQFARLRGNSNDIGTGNAATKPKYPDMKLYQEIILLENYYKGVYCIENVEPYYTPLINPQKAGRHLFWSNFYVSTFGNENNVIIKNLTSKEIVFNFDLKKYTGIDKRKTLRNLVDPKLGLHIFNCAFRNKQGVFF